MTSKTSLFNTGIYKSTVRRYIWGSVLYAILLFMTTGMPILFSVDPKTHWMANSSYNYDLILSESYIYLPLIISAVVPTVVALLVYRFVHSKKTSIFMHSLPVSRVANYISTLAASLTLMLLPLILNGAILALISLCGWGEIFSVASCLTWTGINLLTVFLMFSASSFCAFLTGNSFALAALNILLHLIAIIIAGSFSTLADTFLYGYYESNALINAATEWNFPVYIFSIANHLDSRGEIPFDFIKLAIMLVLALGLYAAALVLYKKRRLETAEDVAAYKMLNPIFKYLLTFLAAVGTFSICSYNLGNGTFYPVFIVLIVSAVVYFASEMLLKKSLKIWNSYKGYAAFLVLFAVLICTFAFTSCFGFETRVPDIEDIASAAVYEMRVYDEVPYVEDAEILRIATELHSELIKRENTYTLRPAISVRSANLYLNYKLKNGKTVSRRYPVTEEMLCEVMDTLYQSQNYRTKNLEIFSDKIGEIYRLEIGESNESVTGSNAAELIECMQADLLELDYTEMRNGDNWSSHVWIEYTRADEKEPESGETSRGIYSFYYDVNANYTRTINWLREHGYLDKMFNSSNYDLTVSTYEQWNGSFGQENETKVYEDTVAVAEVYRQRTFAGLPDSVRISDTATKAKIREFVTSTPVRYVPGKDYSYYVCTIEPNGNYVSSIAAFYEDAGSLAEFTK